MSERTMTMYLGSSRLLPVLVREASGADLAAVTIEMAVVPRARVGVSLVDVVDDDWWPPTTTTYPAAGQVRVALLCRPTERGRYAVAVRLVDDPEVELIDAGTLLVI